MSLAETYSNPRARTPLGHADRPAFRPDV